MKVSVTTVIELHSLLRCRGSGEELMVSTMPDGRIMLPVELLQDRIMCQL